MGLPPVGMSTTGVKVQLSKRMPADDGWGVANADAASTATQPTPARSERNSFMANPFEKRERLTVVRTADGRAKPLPEEIEYQKSVSLSTIRVQGFP